MSLPSVGQIKNIETFVPISSGENHSLVSPALRNHFQAIQK